MNRVKSTSAAAAPAPYAGKTEKTAVSTALNPVPLAPAMRSKVPRMLGVLLCYNDADILADAIEALLENNHHLIVWNHGSTDETASVLDKYAENFVERIFLSREFDFYKLYPTVSQHLMQNYVSKYDWISWPDQDEILEGPDRSKSYPEFVQQVLDEGYSHVRFENYNFWFTNADDQSIESPARRIRHYALFPDCAPRIRAWKAGVTNERWFNHNPLEGKEYPRPFRLRHYPTRDYEKALRRILIDRRGIQRDGANVHYNAITRNLDQIIISPEQLHFDNGVDNLRDEILFDWKTLYR